MWAGCGTLHVMSTTVELELPDTLVDFIDSQVGPDGFPDRQTAIMAAVSEWQEASQDLLEAIQVGLDAEAAGDVELIDDLDAWFADKWPRKTA